jgi:hypothetical protein
VPETQKRSVRATEKRLLWRAISAGAAAISVVVTQHVLAALWRRLEGGSAPPEGPADPTVTMAAAVTWAVATGVGVGVTRLLAVRLSERVWEAATHELPPQVGET